MSLKESICLLASAICSGGRNNDVICQIRESNNQKVSAAQWAEAMIDAETIKQSFEAVKVAPRRKEKRHAMA